VRGVLRWVLGGLVVGVIFGCVIVGCVRSGEGVPPPSAAQDAAWQNIVSAHTTGIVSRHAKIRVLFAGDITKEEMVGRSAGDVLTFEPEIKGVARFGGLREVVFTPSKDLKPGQTYRVRLSPKGLNGVPESLSPYEFAVRIQQPGMEVDVVGLSPENTSSMSLRGTLTTADVESTAQIEKLLSANHAGKALKVVWQHDSDTVHHHFNIAGIQRTAAPSAVEIVWDGTPIGSSTRGKRVVDVPPRDQFSVMQATAIDDGGQRYISVRFSNPLDTRQDLRGLVQLSTGNFTTRIEDSVLKIFPERANDGDASVTLQSGIRSVGGDRLEKLSQHTVAFAGSRPQVRFVGSGVILPASKTLAVPFEAVNIRAVRVTAFEIHEENIGQFLQVNPLSGSSELGRVGRHLWRKKVSLTAVEPGRWNRYSLDLSELFKQHPRALVQLTLSIQRSDSTYECPGSTSDEADVEPPMPDQDDNNTTEASNWDYAEEYFGATDGSTWNDRDNPCKDAYYQYTQGIKQARNFLASNIGLTAKRDQHGKFLIAATDLRTSRPLAGVKLSLRNYQNQDVGSVTTDAVGLAQLTPTGTPFTLLAEKDGERGYLKVNAGTSLPVSHFDVGGEAVTKGLKGFIYGERGVWRPGDSIYLTFVLQDLEKRLPPDHPVTMELYNPRGQRAQSITNAKPANGFYSFTLATDADAPTGDWTAKALLGGATFTKTLKIETVMPNRLKVELDVGNDSWQAGKPLRAQLSSEWLTGAAADSLDADVSVRLSATTTRFDRFVDFVFDDPSRETKPQPETIFQGKLDAKGRASFEKTIEPSSPPAGMLSAAFTSRVFERGGAFSISRTTSSFAPYERFIGIKLPKGDVARGMLRTDEPHTVEVASLSPSGQPVSISDIHITLYQIEWRWWWDQSGESLAQFEQASRSTVVQEGTVSTQNGRGQWEFTVKYPQWGRYLLRACDVKGGHCTGKTVYIDWPSWAGRRQEQSGPAASALTLTTDKEQYVVGDTATVQLPEASEGRALVTIESGTGILQARWLTLADKQTRFTVPITADMSPNVYVSVTLVQPHENKDNDRPIRLYGVIPLKVGNPATHLQPVIRTANEWRPESNVSVEVAESSGHEMTYTLAIVDEGLLGLTSFKTPDLHQHFYKREALGVITWDLFDDVAGAYGAQLERLLALGGSDKQEASNPDERQSRFPPVVKVLGPFTLKRGLTAKHEVKLPPYVGSVRVMVVAGYSGAYGTADKAVFVRQPLMILPTLPRVIGPNEDAAVPVSLFVMDESIRSVTLTAETDNHFELVDGDTVTVAFDRPGDKVGLLRIKAQPRVGRGRVKFVAFSGKHRAEAEVFLEVRSPNPATMTYITKVLKPKERWQTQFIPHGFPGTNTTTLEVSAVPPLGLERHLDYLVHYPYGCLEQTTSSVFPQLYLPALVKLDDARRERIEQNVRAGIQKLRGFQQPNGAFTYWPGGFFVGVNDVRAAWSTNYAGHFLLEANRLGYSVPQDMLKDWLRYQSGSAVAWTPSGSASSLDQAYRLYTLALANQAEIGAMNRLRETANLPSTERWMLAAAYKLAGMSDAAEDLVRNESIKFRGNPELDEIFSSPLRNSAIVLNSAVVMGRHDQAKVLADEIAAQLASDNWHSTQSVAYSLMAMSRYVGAGTMSPFTFTVNAAGTRDTVESTTPVHNALLKGFPDSGAPIVFENTSGRTLFVTVFNRGIPAAGKDDATAQGFSLDINYTDATGQRINVSKLTQGTDLIAEITIRNQTEHRIDNIAFTQMVPAGWEIENERMNGGTVEGTRDNVDTNRRNFFWFPDGSPDATAARPEFVDIRDDRIYRYFSLKAGESIFFRTRLNASYRGHYYLPSLSVEAMYDATKSARSQGQWIDVTAAGR
jgi:alpha-2-macroglobulin